MFTYPKNVRFTCTKCALCCGDTPSKTRHILLLSQEAQDISKATNQPPNNFATPTEGSEPYVLEIKKTIDGKCVFLKDSQCTIYLHRPLICRFYPIELRTEDNQQVFSCTSECPALGQGEKLGKEFFDALFNLAKEKLDS